MPWSLGRLTEAVDRLQRAVPLTFNWYTGRTQPPVEQTQILFWEDVNAEVAKILMRRGAKTYVFSSYLANPGSSSITIHLDAHAHRHASSGSTLADTATDPIGPYNFSWTGTHSFSPTVNTTPITVNAGSVLTAAMQAWNPASGYDTIVTKDGYIGVKDEAPSAMVSIRKMSELGPTNFIEFTGATQNINFSNAGADNWLYTSNTSFTVEVLMKFPVGFPDTVFVIGGHGYTVGTNQQWSWRIAYNTGLISINHIRSVTASYSVNSGDNATDLRDGLWHNIGIKVQNSLRTVSLYIDGVFANSGTTGTTPDDLSTSFQGAPGNFIRFGHLGIGEFPGDPTGICLGGLLIRDGTTFVSTPPNLHEIIPPADVATTLDIKRYWPMTAGSGQAIADLGTTYGGAHNGYFGTDPVNADSADPVWSISAVGGAGTPVPLQDWKTATGTIDSIINTSLNFGLGTAAPTAKLHVQASSNQLRLGTTASAYTNLNDSGVTARSYTLPTTNALATLGVLHNSIPSAGASTLSWSLVSLTADVSGALPLINGGTNNALAAAVNGAVVWSNATQLALTAAGSSGQLLRSAGAASPTWTTATFPATAAAGDLLYGSATNVWSLRTVGTAGDILRVVTGAPTWQSFATAGLVSGTGTTNTLPKWTSTTALGNSGITDDGTAIVLGGLGYTGSTIRGTIGFRDPTSGFITTLDNTTATADHSVRFQDWGGAAFTDSGAGFNAGSLSAFDDPLLTWSPLNSDGGGFKAYSGAGSFFFSISQSGNDGLVTCDATGSSSARWKFTGASLSPLIDVAGKIKATAFNNLTLVDNGIGRTLNIAASKSLTVSNTLTLAGTNSTTHTFPSTSSSVARIDAAQTFVGVQTITGDLKLGTAGNGLYVKEGTNATMGVSGAMVLGVIVVNTTKVTANSRIFLVVAALGTVLAPKAVYVSAITAGTSFTITSADLTDTSTVAWLLVEPA